MVRSSPSMTGVSPNDFDSEWISSVCEVTVR
jgi:hypothetical protein